MYIKIILIIKGKMKFFWEIFLFKLIELENKIIIIVRELIVKCIIIEF